MVALLIVVAFAPSIRIERANAAETIVVPDDYPTIQEAINSASNGDTIYVSSGTYYEHVVVNKTVTLAGEDRQNTAIDGGGVDEYVLTVSADLANITGLTIRRGGGGYICVFITHSENVSFTNNSIHSSGAHALSLYDGCKYSTIANNTIFSNGMDGIALFHADENYISDNYISDNSHIQGTAGIFISDYCSNNTISGNTIENNAGIGGLYVLPTSPNNKIYHNNFLNNPPGNARTWSNNTWDNGYPSGGNYWSDYGGVDAKSGPNQDLLGNDGIVDSPRFIDANNRDRYPLTHPYGSIQNLNTSLTYFTIQSAINAPETQDRHVIFVRNGTYYENVVVNKAISLLGESKNSTVIDGKDVWDVVTVSSNNVAISGFCIRNGKPDVWYGGVHVYYATGTVVTGNIITENWDGIRFDGAQYSSVSCNNLSANIDGGVDMSDSSNNVINNNIISHCYSGIWLNGGDYNNTFASNVISWIGGPEGGVGMWGGSSNNKFVNNTVALCWNRMFYIGDHASGNTFFHNNFINNTSQTVVGTTNIWDDGYPSGGNYWSDYGGNDSDGDDIGDTPYIINEANQDSFPSMNPYWISADVNHDLIVDILDVVTITTCYESTPLNPGWNPHADIAEPYGLIDIFDVVTCTSHYDEKLQWLS